MSEQTSSTNGSQKDPAGEFANAFGAIPEAQESLRGERLENIVCEGPFPLAGLIESLIKFHRKVEDTEPITSGKAEYGLHVCCDEHINNAPYVYICTSGNGGFMNPKIYSLDVLRPCVMEGKSELTYMITEDKATGQLIFNEINKKEIIPHQNPNGPFYITFRYSLNPQHKYQLKFAFEWMDSKKEQRKLEEKQTKASQ